MSLIATLAARLAQVALVAPAISRMKRRAIRMAIGGVLAGVFGLFGLGYLLVTLRIVLERYIGPVWAPLAIGGVLCLAALIAYLVYLKPGKQTEQHVPASRSELPRSIAEPVHRLESQVAGNPLLSIGVALAGGFAAATVMRMVQRQRKRNAKPAAAPRTNGRADPDAWVREVVLRETDRRKTNGRSARP